MVVHWIFSFWQEQEMSCHPHVLPKHGISLTLHCMDPKYFCFILAELCTTSVLYFCHSYHAQFHCREILASLGIFSRVKILG